MLTELPDLYALHGIGPACFHDDYADMAREFVSKVRAAPRRAFRPDMTSNDWYAGLFCLIRTCRCTIAM
jgi:hypothetical protein